MKFLSQSKKRVFFSLILSLMMAPWAQNLLAQSPGDVNDDNSINIIDALKVARYYVGLIGRGDINVNNADTDGNGSITIIDALLIAQYYVGLINTFPGQGAPPVPTTGNGGYSFSGTLNNGYINGLPVFYTTTATSNGGTVTITFDGGPGFEWVWLFTPGHNITSNTSGTVWSISLSGYNAGDILEYYFTVRKEGQEANNNDARHVWIVGSGSSATIPPTPAPTLPYPTNSGGYNLVWSDEFDGSIGPDWVFETGNGSGGWGNNELEYYRQENASIINGELVITAKQESYGGCGYTSVRMKTQGRKSWKYGKIEARIKLPVGQGIWPAFWMLGDSITSVNWPACGEIDIMEHINNENRIHGTIHWQAADYANYGGPVNVDVTNYHVYSIEWDSRAIKWFLDGSQYHEADISNGVNGTTEFHENFFILLNMAVGGNWPGNPDGSAAFPAYMYVDYVRVYRQNGSVPTTTPPTNPPGPTPAGNWQVVWEDTFDGNGRPDSSSWNYHVGNGYNPGAGVFDGWGNGEWEWYRPENAYKENGNLVIRGEYNTSPTNIRGNDYYQFSSRLTTQGKRSWQYGRVEARIAMPSAVGTWPAFWMMGTSCDGSYTSDDSPVLSHYDTMASNWSSCGEVDIMEHKNTDNTVTHNLIWDSRQGVYNWAGDTNNYNATGGIYAGDVTRFHLYTMEWDADEMRWYVDRETNPNPTKTMNLTPAIMEEFRKPFFIILNLAIQGRFTGPVDPDRNDFPVYMYVDYVRVWQQQ